MCLQSVEAVSSHAVVRIGSRDLFVFTRLVGKFEVLLLSIHLKRSSTDSRSTSTKMENIVGASLS